MEVKIEPSIIPEDSSYDASLVVSAADEMKGRRGNDSWVELEGGFVVCVAGGSVVVRGSFILGELPRVQITLGRALRHRPSVETLFHAI